MQVPHVFWREQPEHSACLVTSASAAAASFRRPAAPSVIRSTWGSRPTLQMDALPCGSAWKWVIPALHPVYGLRLRNISRDWLGSTSPPPWIVGLMLVYSNEGMPYRSAIAFIWGISWALRLETTMLIRIGSPASYAPASPRMNRRNDPRRRVIVS